MSTATIVPSELPANSVKYRGNGRSRAAVSPWPAIFREACSRFPRYIEVGVRPVTETRDIPQSDPLYFTDMTGFDPILLDVWREACRHIEIDESAERIFELTRSTLHLAALAIYRYEADERAFHLATSVGVAHETFPGHVAVDADRRAFFEDWARGGELAPVHALPLSGEWESQARPTETARRPPINDAEYASALMGDESVIGLLVLKFDGRRVDLATASRLIEPFSIAAANDARLRELTVLREAAEAERSTLLKKLGMRKLGQDIVGADGGLADVLARVSLVAPTDTPVLIFGETGTGKEVIAREIHNRSERASGPFIRVNCGAIPPGLIDSELFGHERGSFTGAHKTRAGWFERADGGTLFLDEVGELPPEAQVRLLRVLQDGHFERVGGHHEVGVDVRVVAATHRDVSSMVETGSFRQDLWYRLAVFPIDLPPLRDRREDIPELARHFAERAARRFGLSLQLPTEAGLEAMVEYAWPGNIRELAAVIDRAAILGDGRSLQVRAALGMAPGGDRAGPLEDEAASRATAADPPSQDLAGRGGNDESRRAPSAGGAHLDSPHPESEPESRADDFAPRSLDAIVSRHIRDVLAQTDGRIEGPAGAAAILKVNPSTLRSRMRKLAIPR